MLTKKHNDLSHGLYHVLDRGSGEAPTLAGIDSVRRFLQPSYDGAIRIGHVRRAPSEWWRSELECLRQPALERWVNRVYLLEEGTSSSSRYRGYAHIRPAEPGVTGPLPPLADAFLAPPARLRTFKLVGISEASRIYGDTVFFSLPYAMPASELGGFCAHACLYMAMMSMLLYDAKPLGPFEITLWLALRRGGIANVHWGPKLQIPLDIVPTGLSPEESITVLREAGCNLWGLRITWSPTDQGLRLLIRQYIEAGLPVVLHVDYTKLYPDRERPEPGKERHSILLVGVEENNDATTFVYHDPFEGPFIEVGWDTLQKSLYVFPAEHGEESIKAIVVAPASVRQSITDCHADTSETITWQLELISRHQFYRRLTRILIQNFHPINPDSMKRILDSLTVLVPETEVPEYVWFMLKPRSYSSSGDVAYLYDATTNPEVKQTVKRIGRASIEIRDSGFFATFQQGLHGFARRAHLDNFRLVLEEVDPQGRVSAH